MRNNVMTDFVALLGVKGGPAIRPGSNLPTSILLNINDKKILVDAGLGASKSICDQGVTLGEIDAIFITHLHSDHYIELGPLIHTAWVSGRTTPLPIYGPSRLKHYWETFLLAMEDDIKLRIDDEGRIDIAKLVTCYQLKDQDNLGIDGIVVRVMKNIHPPIEESYALRFEWQERSVVLSGDTAYMPAMIEFANGVDLLVHEAMLIAGIDEIVRRHPNSDDKLRQHLLRSHTTAEEVGRIATEAKVKKLALNHFVPDGFPQFGEDEWRRATQATWNGDLIIGRDGMKIEL